MDASDDGGTAIHEIELEGSGQWFIIAISMDHVDVNLTIINSKGDLVAEDMQPDWYPFVSIETKESESMKVNVSSPRGDTPYRLFLFKAVPVGNQG